MATTERMADAPLAFWRQGETSGTTMVDSSGNGRNGTYVSGYTLNQPSLVYNDADPAVNYTGYSSVPYAAWMDLTTFTVEAVIKPTLVNIDRNIITHGRFDSTLQHFHLAMNNGKLYPQIGFTDGTLLDEIVTGMTAFAAGQTCHVAMSWDGSFARVYFNGEKVYTSADLSSKTIRMDSGPLLINCSRDGADVAGYRPGSGVIDDVAIYGTALSDARIAAHKVETVGPTQDRVSAFYTQALVSLDVAPTQVAAFYEQVLVKQYSLGPQVKWWDGDSLETALLTGWWDGAAIQPINDGVTGWWDGAAIQPLS